MTDAELDAEMSKEGISSGEKRPEDMSDAELDAELAKAANEDHPPFGKFDAFVGQALDTATMGNAPQVVSAMKNLSVSSPGYIQDRDNYREGLNKSPEFMAKAVGTGAGIAAPMMAGPVSSVVEAPNIANFTTNALKNFGIGEAMSALQNPGDVPGQTAGLQLDERLQNAKDPTTLLTNAATALVGAAVKAKTDRMAINKDNTAFKALEPMAKNAESLVDFGADEMTDDRAKQIGSLVRNSGILKGSPNITEIAKRTSNKLEEYGKQIGSIFSKLDDKIKYNNKAGTFPKFSVDALAENLNRKFEGQGKLANEVATEVEQIILDRFKFKDGELRLSDLQTMRQNVQKRVNYKIVHNDNAGAVKNDMFSHAATYFNDYIDDIVNKNSALFGKQASAELKIANKQFSLMTEASKIATKAAAKANTTNDAKRFVENIFSPLSVASGLGAGLATHNPLIGIGAAAAGVGVGMAKSALGPKANAMVANLANSSKLMRAGSNVTPSLTAAGYAFQPPPPQLTPYDIDRHIKNDPNMTPSQKAKARTQNAKGSQ